MNRRNFIESMTAAFTSVLSTSVLASTESLNLHTSLSLKSDPLEMGNDFFLSKINPIATDDQIFIERKALEIAEMPQIKKAKKIVNFRWKIIAGNNVPKEALGQRFEELIDEYCFAYVLKAVNSDSSRPKVLHNVYGPPHEWFGMKVPGCRAGGGDNVDNNYSYIPVNGYSNYILRGKQSANPTVDVPITLSGNVSMTMPLGGLDWQDIEIDDKGEFFVTLGPDPARGKRNHIQTTLDSCCLFMRDCRSDWDQIPNSYQIEKVDGPSYPPLTNDQIAARASQYMIDSVPVMYWWNRVMDDLPVNKTHMVDIASMGGLVTQKLSFFRLNIKEDEAFIIKTGAANAKYRSLILQDFWFRSFDYWNNTSTLNSAQSETEDDGTTTYVVSHQDLGVDNWLDTCGQSYLLVCARWQGMPKNNNAEPWITGELIKIGQIEDKLPGKSGMVSNEMRQKQLDKRKLQFSKRFQL